MTDKILPKTRIDAFLETLQKDRDVHAPVIRDNALVWGTVESVDELVFDFQNTDLSPKEFFFPQDECMMRFVNKGAGKDGDEEPPQGMIFKEVPGKQR